MFDQIKQAVSIPMAMQRYTGWNGKKRCKCVLCNSSRNDSMVIYENHFKCFACGAAGDIVKLVSILMNTGQREAAEILESDFGLSRPADIKAAQREYMQKQKQNKLNKRIERRAWNILAAYHRKLICSNDQAELDKIEYFCECFIFEPFEARLKWALENAEFLRRIAE